MADIDVRERRGNRKSLADILRAVLAQVGNTEAEWPLERFLKTGDDATGTRDERALREDERNPVTTDLADLWRRLAVARRHDKIVYDDAAR